MIDKESDLHGGLDDLGLPPVPMIPGDDQDDDFEISFVEEAQQPEEQTRLRGQNEDEADEIAEDHDGLSDIENPKIRDRIMRERRLRQEDAERANREVEQIERALRASEKQKLAVQRDAFKLSLDGLDVRIRSATEALKASREDGDVSAETDIESHLQELRQVRKDLEQQQARLPSEQDIDAAFDQQMNNRRAQAQAQRPRDTSDNVRPLNEKAGRWANNNSWMNDPSRAAEKAALLAINNQLVNEGLDASNDEFFEQLSKRMAKTFPGLAIKDLNGRQLTQTARPGAPSRSPNQPPVAGARNASPPPSRPTSSTRVELDRADRAMMRSLGIDPSNKAMVQRYAREKFMRTRSEQNGR